MYICILYRQLNPMHCLESIVWFFKINKFSEKSKMISEERDSPTTCFSFCLICFKCKLDHCTWHFEPGAWHLIYSIPINCHKIEKIQNLSREWPFSCNISNIQEIEATMQPIKAIQHLVMMRENDLKLPVKYF